MTENERAKASKSDWHPIMRLIIENPISAFNTAAILFGGGFVYSSNEHRAGQLAERITKIEQQAERENAVSSAKETLTAQKFDIINQRLNDLAVSLRGVETSTQFIAQQVREQMQQQIRDNRRGPQ
ncbi:MAG: hypothetical protein ACK4MV_16620 [Beijerinckiaceae bacterium]